MKFLQHIPPAEIFAGRISFAKNLDNRTKFIIWMSCRLREAEKHLPAGFEDEYAEFKSVCCSERRMKIEKLYPEYCAFWGIDE